jgi:hypothetical protein
LNIPGGQSAGLTHMASLLGVTVHRPRPGLHGLTKLEHTWGTVSLAGAHGQPTARDGTQAQARTTGIN